MAVALRGAAALLVVLVLSGSVTPLVPVAAMDGNATAPMPRASQGEQRQPATTQQGPATGEVDPGEPAVQSAPVAASAEAAQDPDTVHVVQQFERVPEQPGIVRVRVVYTVPDRIISLRTEIPDEATLSAREGFTAANDTHFRWTTTTHRPSLTYELPVNETVDRTDPEATDGRYLYADTADWSLFQRPTAPTNWEATGRTPVAYDRRSVTVGPGEAGQWMVFLGEHAVHQRTAHDQQFRLVVPAAANTTESPDAILDALANSSDALRVGDRDDRVFLIAAPTDGASWGVRGVQTGDTDIWVRDTERLDEADSAWIHEYVHSRQSFTPTGRTAWFAEGSASYYAALLSLEQDAIDFKAFDARLRAGTDPAYDNVVLSNVSTWQQYPEYDRGALVAGQLDRRLRVETDRERTLQDVFRSMNEQQGPVTQLDFLEALATAGGTGTLDVGQTYTETTANVSTWNRTTHAAVFGQLPARIGFELPPPEESDAYRISGAYRNTTVDDSDPIVLVTDERLSIDAVVDNVGGTAGDYNLSMRVNGTVVDETSGRIEAGQSTTATLSHRFSTPGQYVVSVDGRTVNVTVQRPASARVAGLSVDQAEIRQGESVGLTATVHNTASVPGEAIVVFTRDFEAVDRSRVTVPPNETVFVTRQIVMSTAGTVSLGAGSVRPIEVSVEPVPVQTTGGDSATATGTATTTATGSDQPSRTARTTRTDSPTPTDTSGPGFGPVAVLLALVVLFVGRAANCRR